MSNERLHPLHSSEMPYRRHLSALSPPLLMSMSACIDSHGLAKNRPAHHTEDGFQNNYLPPERMTKSFSKLWRWSQNRIEQEPVQFESIEPDVDFLRKKPNSPNTDMDWTLDIPLAISRGQFDYRSPSDSTSIASKFFGIKEIGGTRNISNGPSCH